MTPLSSKNRSSWDTKESCHALLFPWRYFKSSASVGKTVSRHFPHFEDPKHLEPDDSMIVATRLSS
jgi:hypothetical protein